MFLQLRWLFCKFGHVRLKLADVCHLILHEVQYTRCGIKNNPLRKIKFLKNYYTYIAVFLVFNAKEITYHICKFH